MKADDFKVTILCARCSFGTGGAILLQPCLSERCGKIASLYTVSCAAGLNVSVQVQTNQGVLLFARRAISTAHSASVRLGHASDGSSAIRFAVIQGIRVTDSTAIEPGTTMRNAGAVAAAVTLAVADAAHVQNGTAAPLRMAIGLAVISRVGIADAALIDPTPAVRHPGTVGAAIVAATHRAGVRSSPATPHAVAA